jgi:hypothetical protein
MREPLSRPEQDDTGLPRHPFGIIRRLRSAMREYAVVNLAEMLAARKLEIGS